MRNVLIPKLEKGVFFVPGHKHIVHPTVVLMIFQRCAAIHQVRHRPNNGQDDYSQSSHCLCCGGGLGSGDKDDHAYSENGGRDEDQAHDHVVCSGDERIHGGEHMV